eukprot:GHVS01014965.1.p1 GENE.GHVS01014965.1~~GHVS01014965.1.p1  ORF type:complete len:1381 (+),score=358.66 GHVS01014965.1:233-4375(+)
MRRTSASLPQTPSFLLSLPLPTSNDASVSPSSPPFLSFRLRSPARLSSSQLPSPPFPSISTPVSSSSLLPPPLSPYQKQPNYQPTFKSQSSRRFRRLGHARVLLCKVLNRHNRPEQQQQRKTTSVKKRESNWRETERNKPETKKKNCNIIAKKDKDNHDLLSLECFVSVEHQYIKPSQELNITTTRQVFSSSVQSKQILTSSSDVPLSFHPSSSLPFPSSPLPSYHPTTNSTLTNPPTLLSKQIIANNSNHINLHSAPSSSSPFLDTTTTPCSFASSFFVDSKSPLSQICPSIPSTPQSILLSPISSSRQEPLTTSSFRVSSPFDLSSSPSTPSLPASAPPSPPTPIRLPSVVYFDTHNVSYPGCSHSASSSICSTTAGVQTPPPPPVDCLSPPRSLTPVDCLSPPPVELLPVDITSLILPLPPPPPKPQITFTNLSPMTTTLTTSSSSSDLPPPSPPPLSSSPRFPLLLPHSPFPVASSSSEDDVDEVPLEAPALAPPLSASSSLRSPAPPLASPRRSPVNISSVFPEVSSPPTPTHSRSSHSSLAIAQLSVQLLWCGHFDQAEALLRSSAETDLHHAVLLMETRAAKAAISSSFPSSQFTQSLSTAESLLKSSSFTTNVGPCDNRACVCSQTEFRDILSSEVFMFKAIISFHAGQKIKAFWHVRHAYSLISPLEASLLPRLLDNHRNYPPSSSPSSSLPPPHICSSSSSISPSTSPLSSPYHNIILYIDDIAFSRLLTLLGLMRLLPSLLPSSVPSSALPSSLVLLLLRITRLPSVSCLAGSLEYFSAAAAQERGPAAPLAALLAGLVTGWGGGEQMGGRELRGCQGRGGQKRECEQIGSGRPDRLDSCNQTSTLIVDTPTVGMLFDASPRTSGRIHRSSPNIVLSSSSSPRPLSSQCSPPPSLTSFVLLSEGPRRSPQHRLLHLLTVYVHSPLLHLLSGLVAQRNGLLSDAASHFASALACASGTRDGDKQRRGGEDDGSGEVVYDVLRLRIMMELGWVQLSRSKAVEAKEWFKRAREQAHASGEASISKCTYCSNNDSTAAAEPGGIFDNTMHLDPTIGSARASIKQTAPLSASLHAPPAPSHSNSLILVLLAACHGSVGEDVSALSLLSSIDSTTNDYSAAAAFSSSTLTFSSSSSTSRDCVSLARLWCGYRPTGPLLSLELLLFTRRIDGLLDEELSNLLHTLECCAPAAGAIHPPQTPPDNNHVGELHNMATTSPFTFNSLSATTGADIPSLACSSVPSDGLSSEHLEMLSYSLLKLSLLFRLDRCAEAHPVARWFNEVDVCTVPHMWRHLTAHGLYWAGKVLRGVGMDGAALECWAKARKVESGYLFVIERKIEKMIEVVKCSKTSQRNKGEDRTEKGREQKTDNRKKQSLW